MQNQSSSTPEKLATPMPLPSPTDSVISILENPNTPVDVFNALADSVQEAFTEAGIENDNETMRFKLRRLFRETDTARTESEAPDTMTQRQPNETTTGTPSNQDDRRPDKARIPSRAEVAKALNSAYDLVDLHSTANEEDSVGDDMRTVAMHAVGLAESVFDDKAEAWQTYKSLLIAGLADLDGKPKPAAGDGPSPQPAANQGPGLADLHRRFFELHLRRMVRAFKTMEGNFDEVYKSIVDPENHVASPSLEDLVLDFRDMKRTIQQFSVLFGIDPRTVYDEADDMESESF